MNFYITNYSHNVFAKRKFITLHYFEGCKTSNANYEKNSDFAANSGVKDISFETEKEFLNFISKNNCTYVVCTSCEQKECAQSYDENLKDLSRDSGLSKGVMDEFERVILQLI